MEFASPYSFAYQRVPLRSLCAAGGAFSDLFKRSIILSPTLGAAVGLNLQFIDCGVLTDEGRNRTRSG